MSEPTKMMLLSGDKYIPCDVWDNEEDWIFKIPPPWVAPDLFGEIRVMKGRTFDFPNKLWKVPKLKRNYVALGYLLKDGDDPFERYFDDIPHINTERPLWEHQQWMLDFIMARQQCIVAAEQGTGKTLAYIEAMERSGIDPNEIWYVSTIPSIASLREELEYWESSVTPKIFTFDKLTRLVENWEEGMMPPRFLIGDESQKLKGTRSKRSIAFSRLSDAMREVYDKSFVILGTGTPAPKAPTDWWMQCEIACPGFVKEGDVKYFESNLSLVEFEETDAGQKRPKRITWWDDEKKCKKCGCFKGDCHKGDDCIYQASVNEIARLDDRLEGLVLNIRKKDVQKDLPDKFYKVWRLPISKEMEETSKFVTEHSVTAIETLVNLRALSDGFQYYEEKTGETKPCPFCNEGVSDEARLEEFDDDDYYDDDVTDFESFEEFGTVSEGTCEMCEGTGLLDKVKRKYTTINTPKLEATEQILSDHEDGGRIVIFGAFQAALDRVEELCLKNGWTVFKIDGRGWKCSTPENAGPRILKRDMIKVFQRRHKNEDLSIERVVWLGHPKSSGTGLTLTESPTILYYSNSFDGEDRMQSEDRIHRPGMDINKGATIIDLIHLQADELVMDNLRNKVLLQSLSLGDISKAMNDFSRGTQDELVHT